MLELVHTICSKGGNLTGQNAHASHDLNEVIPAAVCSSMHTLYATRLYCDISVGLLARRERAQHFDARMRLAWCTHKTFYLHTEYHKIDPGKAVLESLSEDGA